jgi:hypothetical protein
MLVSRTRFSGALTETHNQQKKHDEERVVRNSTCTYLQGAKLTKLIAVKLLILGCWVPKTHCTETSAHTN